MTPTDNASLGLDYLRNQTIGVDARIETPFGERLMLYADYTASGRSLQFVEDYLVGLQRLYANSHTEDDFSGRVTTNLLHQAEERIKRAVNAGPDGRIIACGTGATGAIDRMQQLVGVKLPPAGRALIEALLRGYLGERLSITLAHWITTSFMTSRRVRRPGRRVYCRHSRRRWRSMSRKRSVWT